MNGRQIRRAGEERLSAGALDRDRHRPVSVTVPRVRDRTGQRIRFESKLVPTYVRRAKSIGAVLAWLYLRGIYQADTGPALQARVGKDVAR
jgi:hypothetical protein